MESHNKKYLNPNEMLKIVRSLRTNQEIKIFLKEYLPESYNLELHKIYLSILDEADLISGYEYVINKLHCHWDILPLVKGYLELIKNIDYQEYLDKSRNVFHKCLKSPMDNFNELVKMYEVFENGNGPGGKKIFSEMTNTFQNTFKLFKMYRNGKENIELELKNVMGLEDDEFYQRMKFVFEYHLDKFFYDDEIYLKYVQFLLSIKENPIGVLEKGLMINNTPVLILCYSLYSGDESYILNEIKNCNQMILSECDNLDKKISNMELKNRMDMLSIGLLNLRLKKDYSKFAETLEMLDELSVSEKVYIYAAEAEFYTTGNKESAFKIFSYANEKFKSEQIKKEFLNFLLKIGLDQNARNIYNSLYRPFMDEIMGIYEYKYGNMQNFFDIFIKYKYPYKLFTSCLDISNESDILKSFIEKLPILPENENFLNRCVNSILDILVNFQKK